MSHRSIIVLPDDTGGEIISAIEQAERSILIKMFLFSDPDLLNAVVAAKKRGIDVRVMLNPARRNGEEENEETRNDFGTLITFKFERRFVFLDRKRPTGTTRRSESAR